jgi:hypothetical protein
VISYKKQGRIGGANEGYEKEERLVNRNRK